MSSYLASLIENRPIKYHLGHVNSHIKNALQFLVWISSGWMTAIKLISNRFELPLWSYTTYLIAWVSASWHQTTINTGAPFTNMVQLKS